MAKDATTALDLTNLFIKDLTAAGIRDLQLRHKEEVQRLQQEVHTLRAKLEEKTKREKTKLGGSDANIELGRMNPLPPAVEQLQRELLERTGDLERLRQKQDGDLDQLRKSHAAELETLRHQQLARLEAIRQQHAPDVASLRRQHADELAELQRDHAERIDDLMEKKNKSERKVREFKQALDLCKEKLKAYERQKLT